MHYVCSCRWVNVPGELYVIVAVTTNTLLSFSYSCHVNGKKDDRAVLIYDHVRVVHTSLLSIDDWETTTTRKWLLAYNSHCRVDRFRRCMNNNSVCRFKPNYTLYSMTISINKVSLPGFSLLFENEFWTIAHEYFNKTPMTNWILFNKNASYGYEIIWF